MTRQSDAARSRELALQTAGDRLLFAEGDLLVTPTRLQGRSWTLAAASITGVELREDGRLIDLPRQYPGVLVALAVFALLALLGLYLVRPVYRIVVEEPTGPVDVERAVALFFVGMPLLAAGALGMLALACPRWRAPHPNATVTLHTADGDTLHWAFTDLSTARRFRRAVEEAMRPPDEPVA